MQTSPSLAWRIGAAISMAALTGCSTTTPTLDRQFGHSVAVLKAQQVIDPAASSRTTPLTTDGETAREMINRYHKSYKAPSPQPGAFTIGTVGAGG